MPLAVRPDSSSPFLCAEWCSSCCEYHDTFDQVAGVRGIQLIHAVRIVAELGDLVRFGHPRRLMGYLGLIPSEDDVPKAVVDIAWTVALQWHHRASRNFRCGLGPEVAPY